jgi:DNA-binding CsgD family transcriptional regulator/PAS domain-containing protein
MAHRTFVLYLSPTVVLLDDGLGGWALMTRADAVVAAMQQIHEASLSPASWARALASIAQALQSERGILLVQNTSRKTEYAVSFEMTSEQTACFAGVASSGSKLWETIRALPVGSVAPTSALLPDSEYARTRFYNEGIRPLGAFHGLVVSPLSSPQSFVHFSTGRLLGRQDYDREDIATLRVLVPHLVTALQVAHRLASVDLQMAAAASALDHVETAVVLVDAAAKILFTNRAAEAILARNDGLRIDRDGLCTFSQQTTRALRRLIASCKEVAIANGGPGGKIELPCADGRGALRVAVSPFRAEEAQIATPWLGAPRPAAIILITDPAREQLARKEDLRHRYGLTRAEADVSMEILKGDGREAAAARLGIAPTTVRAHLSSIFEKTGVCRQAELVRLLMQRAPESVSAEAIKKR